MMAFVRELWSGNRYVDQGLRTLLDFLGGTISSYASYDDRLNLPMWGTKDATHPLDATTQRHWIRETFKKIGYASTQTSHSGRKSGAQWAEIAGVNDEEIRRAGKWNDIPNLPHNFIRTVADHPNEGHYFVDRAQIQPPVSLAVPEVVLELDAMRREFVKLSNTVQQGFERTNRQQQDLEEMLAGASIQYGPRQPPGLTTATAPTALAAHCPRCSRCSRCRCHRYRHYHYRRHHRRHRYRHSPIHNGPVRLQGSGHLVEVATQNRDPLEVVQSFEDVRVARSKSLNWMWETWVPQQKAARGG
ncbi:hypothetical protein Egran_07078 [Elaphomyces granulatus]|uniref:Ndc10 domain-containing protein n=1 Tax=Elaphomyces granulatus TaxID=519963 RepID=A0A232LM22_9EURO|nr:hypothetical protein Egran_07078 [Elaphomyces granulatus]